MKPPTTEIRWAEPADEVKQQLEQILFIAQDAAAMIRDGYGNQDDLAAAFDVVKARAVIATHALRQAVQGA